MSLEFLLTALVVVLMPGTGVIYTLAVGLGRGFKASVAAAAGCTLGIVPAALASIVGLAAIFHTSALAFQAIKIAGVLYLLFMAYKMLREDETLAVSEAEERANIWRIALNGTLLNILNPKLSLFFLAFLPQFVSPQATQPTMVLLGLAAVFMAMTFAVFVVYGAFAASARDHVISRPHVMAWIKRSFAAAFCFLGLRLALAER